MMNKNSPWRKMKYISMMADLYSKINDDDYDDYMNNLMNELQDKFNRLEAVPLSEFYWKLWKVERGRYFIIVNENVEC